MKKEGTAKVSLSMLTYNRADKIARSLDSLLNQTYENFELIINDDASDDDTEAVCREYERKDSRVRYYRNKRNVGYARNNNRAIRRASCEYVGLVHGSDLYEPFMLERWVEALDQHPSAAFVFHAHYRHTNGEPLVHGYPALVKGDVLLDDMLARWDSPVYGITMVRKTCVKRVGWFDPAYPRLADVDMWMRLLNEYDAAYVDEPLVWYSPREPDHELRGVNWEATRQIMDIRRTNILKRFARDPEARDTYMRRYRRDRARRLMRDIAWSVKHRRPTRLKEGAKILKETDSLLLRTVGGFIEWLFASFGSGAVGTG